MKVKDGRAFQTHNMFEFHIKSPVTKDARPKAVTSNSLQSHTKKNSKNHNHVNDGIVR